MFNMRFNPNRRKYGYALITLVSCSLLAVFIGKTYFSKTTVQPAPPIIVRTQLIQSASSGQDYSYAGEVRGRYENQLSFQVNGKIIQRHVEVGSVVQPGDVLMQIDAKDIQQTVNSGSAQVSSAQSQLLLAENNLNRYRQLLYNGAVSRAQYEQYVTAYDTAAALLRQAEAQYTQGSNQLDYSLLHADKAGVVSSITAEAGQVVSAGQTVLTIVQDGEKEIEINVPENRLEELQNSAALTITFWALPHVTLDGKVREIAPMADPVTRTYKVRISLIKPPPNVKLGMTASVILSGGSNVQPVFTIPLAALYQTGDTPAVWIVNDDNCLSLHPIKTGLLGNGTIQVLEGLQTGNRIVIAGVHKLKEGQRVKITGDTP